MAPPPAADESPANGNGTENDSIPGIKSVPLIIDGKDVVTETTFQVTSPSTQKLLYQSSSCSTAEALSAINAAQAAFPAWAATKQAHRRDILGRAADLMMEREDELMSVMMQETGATEGMAKWNVLCGAELLRDTAGKIAAALTGCIPVCEDEGTSALVVKEPYGVVLGIVPWNAPYILGVRAVAQPIAVGNAVVMKGSELCPRAFWTLGSIFRDAGVPDGIVNIIYHRPQDAAEVTRSIIAHRNVKKLSFTGSTATGSIIAATAGKYLKPCLMECGGKASAIICDDADIEKAAEACTWGSFQNSGQICMSTERILVHASILDSFTTALRTSIDKFFPSAADAPILVTAAGVKKTKTLVSNAIASGASILHGDLDLTESTETRMRPIVVGDVTKDMDLFHQETFGPHVSIIPVNSDDEAVDIANDTEYGLSGAVFTRDLARGLSIAKRVESGAVHVNAMTVHDEAALPHGGAKASGWGRFNGEWGLSEFVRLKVITFQGPAL
ncbi:aldehyde dehydrogenase [Aulographum hederae CBS 113979]|uniref:Aldehyde dehydrogenase n=1 Tax=Aulographum hederae CBS 113979 TaxID=1176131 RepID=A0A6G1HBE3_9PEZI|nr:aldehyde dehydrogenase [Aulographum hederae CBS 113979]